MALAHDQRAKVLVPRQSPAAQGRPAFDAKEFDEEGVVAWAICDRLVERESQCGGGSMPLLRMRGAASGDDIRTAAEVSKAD